MSAIKKSLLALGLVVTMFAAAGVSTASACDYGYAPYHAPVYAPAYKPVVRYHVPVQRIYVPVYNSHHSHCYGGGYGW